MHDDDERDDDDLYEGDLDDVDGVEFDEDDLGDEEPDGDDAGEGGTFELSARQDVPRMSHFEGIIWANGPTHRGKPTTKHVAACSSACLDGGRPMHIDPNHIWWRVCDGCDLTVCAIHGAKYEAHGRGGWCSVLCPECDAAPKPEHPERYRRVRHKFEGSTSCHINPAEVQLWAAYDAARGRELSDETNRDTNDRFWSAQLGHFQDPPERIKRAVASLTVGDAYPLLSEVSRVDADEFYGRGTIRAIARGARPSWFKGPGHSPFEFIVGDTYIALEDPKAATMSLFDLAPAS
jgi:hypothetical protein